MILSIDLRSPSELPSFQRVQEAFKYAEEMGLDKGFDDIHVWFIGAKYTSREPLTEPLKQIIFVALYESTFIDDTLANLCSLRIVLEIKEDEIFGRFIIFDPVAKDDIVSSELLPYSELVPLLERAKGIGRLSRDIRASWHTFKGWKDILPYVKHKSSPTKKVS